jgi:hypothetical protein
MNCIYHLTAVSCIHQVTLEFEASELATKEELQARAHGTYWDAFAEVTHHQLPEVNLYRLDEDGTAHWLDRWVLEPYWNCPVPLRRYFLNEEKFKVSLDRFLSDVLAEEEENSEL